MSVVCCRASRCGSATTSTLMRTRCAAVAAIPSVSICTSNLITLCRMAFTLPMSFPNDANICMLQVNFVVMNKVGGMLQRVDYIRKVGHMLPEETDCQSYVCDGHASFCQCSCCWLIGAFCAPAVWLCRHVHPEEREGRVPHPVRRSGLCDSMPIPGNCPPKIDRCCDPRQCLCHPALQGRLDIPRPGHPPDHEGAIVPGRVCLGRVLFVDSHLQSVACTCCKATK